jgi:large subunit ribosomal protein L29
MKWVVTQMKVNKLRDLTVEELERKVDNLKEELFNLRFQMATGQLENPMRIKEVKKDIARAKTILREREIAEQRA